ncbi:MAG: hypothetical protein D6775_08170 [Caldilineae bacterium]|nr:MAG: hypothetical protein D6775_08170 [Caldilineae bacterium]
MSDRCFVSLVDACVYTRGDGKRERLPETLHIVAGLGCDVSAQVDKDTLVVRLSGKVLEEVERELRSRKGRAMSYAQVSTCPHCGAPIYAPSVWSGTTPPPVIFTCDCNPHRAVTESTETRDELRQVEED